MRIYIVLCLPQMKTKLLLALSIFLVSLQTFAQGSLPVKKFSYQDYQAPANVWSFTQDRNGFLYMGTSGSLLQYDGKTWRIAKTEDSVQIGLTARHFYEDNNGKVYAFGDGTLGYFSSNQNNELIFKSLIPQLPEKARRFAIGTRIMKTADGLYFASTDWLARWNGKEFRLWYPPKSNFTRGFEAHGKVYMRENNTGLYVFKNEKLEYIKGSQQLFGIERISFMLPISKGNILVGTRSKGIWLYNPTIQDSTKAFTPLRTSIDVTFYTNSIYDATTLPDKTILINLFTGGVAQLTPEGQFMRWVYQTSEFVTTCYLDKTGQLWLGTSQNGAIRLNISSPYKQWTLNELDNQMPNWLHRFEGKLYGGGVSRLSILKNGVFEKIPNSPIQPFSFVEMNIEGQNKFLVGAFDGVVEVKGETTIPISQGQPIYQIFKHPKFPNNLFVFDRGGFTLLTYSQGKWIKDNTSLKTLSEAKWNNGLGRGFIYEPMSGVLWGVKPNEGVDMITWATQAINKPTITQVPTSEKLKISFINFLYEGKVVFQNTTNQFFTYNHQKGEFEPFKPLQAYQYRKLIIGAVQTDTINKQFFVPISARKGQINNFLRFDVIKMLPNQTISIDSTTHQYFPKQLLLSTSLEQDSTIWVSMNDYLLHYDLKKQTVLPADFKAYIRELRNNQTLVCGVTFCKEDSIAQYLQDEHAKMVLPYSQNDLTFRFAAPYFIDEEATQFSYFLEGFDNTEWSAWTAESKKEYTNLREGTYTFKVKARNVFGRESNIVAYQFTILPPFYRTWWAYTGYTLGAIFVVLGLIYANSRRLLAAQRRLEEMVVQRTAEIEKQKTEIEAQRDNLAEMNEEINMQREEILITAENLKVANNEISKKNEDIVASINYAQRIQFAMLPFEGRIAESIGKENFFILYKPKDIVSGDFYVFEEIDNKLFVAVADCTGHGVPGAFMSMIGNQLLHEIIVRDAVHRPDLVLNKLHIEIRRVLQQEQTGTQDGMDIALVVIYRQEAYFEYAGAMNPMYYVQGEQPTLHELKATKKPIGGRTFDNETERIFAYHTVHFAQQAPTLYLFSDGYCDQFGGQQNRKFMAKRFRETLLAINHQPLAQQKQVLDTTITDWIKEGDEKQIDDILVVGLKLK